MLVTRFHCSHGETCSFFESLLRFLHGSLGDAKHRTPCYLACRHATAACVTSTGRATRRVSSNPPETSSLTFLRASVLSLAPECSAYFCVRLPALTPVISMFPLWKTRRCTVFTYQSDTDDYFHFIVREQVKRELSIVPV